MSEYAQHNSLSGRPWSPGIYFLGLPWQSRRGSAFIWGVWHDAKFVADHIQKLRGYLSYQSATSASVPNTARPAGDSPAATWFTSPIAQPSEVAR